MEGGYLQGEREAKFGSRMVTGGSHIVNQESIKLGLLPWFTNYTKSVGPQLIVSNTTLAVELQTPHRLDQTINIFYLHILFRIYQSILNLVDQTIIHRMF